VNRYLLDNRRPEAGERFAALAELFDPWTFRHFDDLGLGEGWRCWEVGAGGVSVPRGLAERVGTSGRVLATDIDVSWIEPEQDDTTITHPADRPRRLLVSPLPGDLPRPGRLAYQSRCVSKIPIRLA
jgi:hypothetical protein